MTTQLLLALQSLLVPLALSFIVQRFFTRRVEYLDIAIFSAWLVSYVWIAGFPSIVPKEALEWIGPLGLIYMAVRRLRWASPRYIKLVNNLFIFGGITLLSWPVMRHQITPALIVELGSFALISVLISINLSKHTPASPALVLALSSGGLALLASLGGSLLIGQLSGAFASVLGAFALYELINKLERSSLYSGVTFALMLVLSWLLLIARVYAELPFNSIALITFALFIGLILKWRAAFIISLLAVVISLFWFWLTTDNSSYY